MPTSTAVVPNTETAEAVIRTLLLTDLVDSTKLVAKLGDTRAYDIGTRHDRVSRDLLPRFNGLEIDKTDGFLLLFERPIDAVNYALAYHQALAELSVELGVQLRARAGIHLGEIFLRSNDPEDIARGAKPLEVEGLAKPTAARTMSLAGGKQTLLTQGAFDMARQAAGGDDASSRKLRWLAHGPYLFKGVEEAVAIFEIGVEGQAPLTPPADHAKARRAVQAGDEITLGWRPAPGLEIPRRSGWELEKRLGEGGFGEVWLAIQKSTAESRVFKFCYDASQLRSLKREVTLFRLLRESLGNRRDIVRILDWNFDQAPYFIEEELAGGGDLIEWATQQGGLDQVPTVTRLEIGAQVADALAAAHSVGVLHKDVKPSNVLVAADSEGGPQIQLADFGISEVLDEKALLAKGITVMGLTEILTPDGSSSVTGSHLYMAPEVAEGRAASVEADIYALGVMVYQMVVGDLHRALGTGWQRDVGDDLLAADIASLVDREPERRPASTREVAERLRTLEDRRRQLASEHKVRQEAKAARIALARAQRRRKVFGAIAAAAVVVLAIVSVLAVQAVVARRQAETSRGIAENRREQADDLIGFMLGDLREKLTPVGRLEILDAVGEKAMQYFATVPKSELSDDDLARRSMALYQIGDVRIRQGNLPAAVAPLRESLTLARALVERDPENEDRLFGLGQSHFWLGFVFWEQELLAEALEQFEPYLDVSERLVAKAPANLDWQLELSYAHSNIGSVLETQGDLEGALQRFRSTLAINQDLATDDPTKSDWQLELAAAHNTVGKVLGSMGQLAEAHEHFETELEIKKTLVESEPTHTAWRALLATSFNYLGALLQARGESRAAMEHLQEAVALYSELVDLDSENAGWRFGLAINHGVVGGMLRWQGQTNQAFERFRLHQQIIGDLVDSDPTHVIWRRQFAVGHCWQGAALGDLHDWRRALETSRTGVDMLTAVIEQRHGDREAIRMLSECHATMASIWSAQGERSQAVASWRLAAEGIGTIARDSKDWRFLAPWAIALLHLDPTEEAERLASELQAIGYREPRFLQIYQSKRVPPKAPA